MIPILQFNPPPRFLIFALFLIICFGCTSDHEKFPFQNPDLSFEQRADDLLNRLSLEEKISQLNYESKAVPRLGIPEYNWWNECLHGVARSGIATVYPQAIALAATWDKDLMLHVGSSISDEARAKYNDYQSKNKRGIYQGITFWTPNINIFRDPRWGRGMETYGECPELTGEMAVQFIKGLQGNDPTYYKVIATSKHFAVHNGPEPLRHTFNAKVSEYDLRDTYFPAFKKTIQNAKVASVMCAYNRVDDKPCCGSSPLLEQVLRKEWGFDGYVVSDCWALTDFYIKGHHEVVKTGAEAAAMAFKNGTDVNCGIVSKFLKEAVNEGLISEDELDIAVRRLLMARFRLGMFDPVDKVPFNNIPYDVVDSKEHQQLAEKAAKESMVLLRNDQSILPLSKDIKKIAVLGPNANNIEVLLANYNGIPSHPVTPLEGIKAKLPNAKVMYSLGCEHAENLPTLETIPASALFTDQSLSTHGLKARFYDSAGWNRDPVHRRIDETIDYYWWDKAPFPELDGDNFAARWTGYLVVPESGRYAIGGDGAYYYEVILDDSLLAKNQNIHSSIKRYTFLNLEAGKAYKLEVKFYDIHGDANIRLLWARPNVPYASQALDMARQADVVLLFMGLSPRLEGEEMPVHVKGFNGGDRVRIDLPDIQQDFIKKIVAVGKPTVLILLNGSALTINWENEHIPGILEAWYPGQAAGTAIADILFGDYNPSGRLPVTFYKSEADLPPFEDYHMEDGFTYRYFKGTPLYPFGYGQSYTSFKYGTPQSTSSTMSMASDHPIKVTFNLTNTGKRAGEEVAQMYISDKASKEPRPVRDLRGFTRVYLEAGETQEVTFILNKDDLSYWNEDKQTHLPSLGTYDLMVGGSSALSDLQHLALQVTE